MTEKNTSKYLAVLFSICMLMMLTLFMLRKQTHFAYNVVGIYISYLLFLYFEYSIHLKIKNSFRVLVMITVLVHLLFGQYFNLYESAGWFDNVLHLFGGFSFSLFYYEIIISTIPLRIGSKIFIFVFIFALGVTGGVFFEILEYVLDMLFKTTNQRGLVDTNLDLIYNLLGAVLAGTWNALCKRDS
ncbi:hypothetical protein QBE52_04120 [Clostridiaceae bacterium 35-E11]